MKHFFTIISFLLLSVTIWAQPPANNRSIDPANQRTNLSYQKAQKESELESLVDSYQNAGQSRQDILTEQIERTLYDLFDISIQEKENQVSFLNQQLKEMQSSETYEQNSEEIQSLQSALKEVTKSLKLRKENRDLIVQRRLYELLN